MESMCRPRACRSPRSRWRRAQSSGRAARGEELSSTSFKLREVIVRALLIIPDAAACRRSHFFAGRTQSSRHSSREAATARIASRCFLALAAASAASSRRTSSSLPLAGPDESEDGH